jgi:hypothetical protein
LIDELIKADSINSKKIYEFQIEIYNIASQVAHSDYNSLKDIVEKQIKLEKNPNSLIDEFQNFCSNSLMILTFIIELMKEKFGYINEPDLSAKILDFRKYFRGE